MACTILPASRSSTACSRSGSLLGAESAEVDWGATAVCAESSAARQATAKRQQGMNRPKFVFMTTSRFLLLNDTDRMREVPKFALCNIGKQGSHHLQEWHNR